MLSPETWRKLAELAESEPEHALIGLYVCPKTSEMGTFSSHGMEPGAVLGFLQQGVTQMIRAAKSGELEITDGVTRQTAKVEGGTIVH